jgi:hypothetical protein
MRIDDVGVAGRLEVQFPLPCGFPLSPIAFTISSLPMNISSLSIHISCAYSKSVDGPQRGPDWHSVYRDSFTM